MSVLHRKTIGPRQRVRDAKDTKDERDCKDRDCHRARPLRFVTFLAPNLLPFYRFVTHYLGKHLEHATELSVGSSYDELTRADLAFVCGLPYVEARRRGAAVEPLAAPVLADTRCGGRPVYFSDVIVHRDSPFRSFAHLRGQRWAYNEPHSQSGYGITRYHLARQGQTQGYFREVVEAGWHERCIELIAERRVDGAAIDSHVLAVVVRDRPELARRIRVIYTLGPSSIQPVVAARGVPEALKTRLRAALVGMHQDPRARPFLARALVAGFVVVTDATYDDIRAMVAVAEAAEFRILR